MFFFTMPNIPSLFGQNPSNSNRDYSDEKCWGKNQFNSSFPASLVAYMSSKGIEPVYLYTDENNKVQHRYISGTELFGIDPLSKEAYYNFEAHFFPFEKYYIGEREKIDLVMMNKVTDEDLVGLEIKLTALPDNSTKNLSEDKYSCEIVVRPPTINSIACSICNNFKTDEEKEILSGLLPNIPEIEHWEEPEDVLPHYHKILNAVLDVCKYLRNKQTPIIVQPVWKTLGGKSMLADDCLDVFVWSNLAIIQICNRNDSVSNNKITRHMRTIIWIYLMLVDYARVYGQIKYRKIIDTYSYNSKNDKAFASNGMQTYEFLTCNELTHPRISKFEIKNIILGGGQNLLSPERRFDAVLVNSPYLFE